MHLRSILLLLLTLLCLPAQGQDAGDALRKGDESLAAGLWEIAAAHFENALQSADLPADQSAQAAIGLAESWIRQGKSDAALDLLEQSIARNHPEQPFWKGQALASSGRITEAIAQLTPLSEKPDAPHRFETAVSLANLHLSLEQTDVALNSLSGFRKSADPSHAPAILLREVEILIDTQQYPKARTLFSLIEKFPSNLQAHADLLNAHLTLAENQASVAARIFRSLIDQPRGLSLMQFHSAAVGLTDSLLQSEDASTAFAFLVSFIDEHPDSPQLEALFQRIEKIMPEKPLAGDMVLGQLGQWIPTSEISPTGLVPTEEGGCVSSWPSAKVHEKVIPYALFTRALGLDRNDSPQALAESRQLMNRLRAEFPDHPLVNRAMLVLGRRYLMAGLTDQAFHLLTVLRENSKLPQQRGEAAFLQALEAY
jgi:tetratricopeptide (TPR) repeat protein